ncbi:MAG: capsid protein [Eubacterium sp.]|nr:capsid protein [Eubacterium sp.]
MGLVERIRTGIKKFLNIQEASNQSITIYTLLTHEGNVSKNRVWYRGDSYELDQFYKSIENGSGGPKFWAANQTTGQEMRKIHTGIPAIIVDILADIIVNDFNQVEFKDDNHKALWDVIAEKNDFEELLRDAISMTLALGDGAFKLSSDPNISEYPIIEWIDADNVEYVYERGHIKEYKFTSEYEVKRVKYTLVETYGYGYINYSLYQGDKEVPLSLVPVLSNLQDITFDKKIILAQGVQFKKSAKYKGRGQSIFDRKVDSFDALDEAWSQWIDTLRAGRTKEYIPETLVPRDPETGKVITPNSFDNRFIMTQADMKEGAQNKITLEQPAIPHDSYAATYTTALDLCLQGIISPSTLGIDVKKLDNADAQREKEKATLYTRGNIVDMLQKKLPRLINTVFAFNSILAEKTPENVECTISFGEYANPSFESQVETVGKGKTQGIMSIEASVEELYGDSKDEEWKAEEVARLKKEQGITEIYEPAVNMEGVVLDESNGNEPVVPNAKGESTATA